MVLKVVTAVHYRFMTLFFKECAAQAEDDDSEGSWLRMTPIKWRILSLNGSEDSTWLVQDGFHLPVEASWRMNRCCCGLWCDFLDVLYADRYSARVAGCERCGNSMVLDRVVDMWDYSAGVILPGGTLAESTLVFAVRYYIPVSLLYWCMACSILKTGHRSDVDSRLCLQAEHRGFLASHALNICECAQCVQCVSCIQTLSTCQTLQAWEHFCNFTVDVTTGNLVYSNMTRA